MTYESRLPEVFPWRVQTTRSAVRFMIRQLVNPARYLDGKGTASSFALTVDAPEGMWNLWLSDASKNYLVGHMPHLTNTLIETKYDVP